MIRICEAQEIRDLDQRAEKEFGLSQEILMENAALAARDVLFREFPEAGREGMILVLAGKGNNGGDALALARHLNCAGRNIKIIIFHEEQEESLLTKKQHAIIRNMNLECQRIQTPSQINGVFTSDRIDLIVDGILGTGAKGDLSEIILKVIEKVKQRKIPVFALDIPTGVMGDHGVIAQSVLDAKVTISFGFPKLTHFFIPASRSVGKLYHAGISFPPRLNEGGSTYLLRRSDLFPLRTPRDRYAHKNSSGHALLIGGSPGFAGALALAAKACHRSGAGLVSVCCMKENEKIVMKRIHDEAMMIPVDEALEKLKRYQALIVGPGLGTGDEASAWVEKILSEYEGPLLLDADALNLIAQNDWLLKISQRKGQTLLTPHPGEMCRLLKIDQAEILRNPLSHLRSLVKTAQATVVLKGATTLVKGPDTPVYLHHAPRAALATAGSGDVLSGLIGSFLAQRLSTLSAVLLGIGVQTLAHDVLKMGSRGLLAGDLIRVIPAVLKGLEDEPDLESTPILSQF